MKALARINELILLNEPFCLATVLTSSRRGIAPGRQIIIRRDGSLEAATGHIDIDELLSRTALSCFEQRRKASVEIVAGAACVF